MKRLMVHNKTGCPIYVGASMIPAGESRDFPEDQVPEHLRPQETPAQPAAAPVADPLAELLARKATEVIAALPELSDEDLGKLEALEKARAGDDKKGTEPRKTVLEAISALMLERAGGSQG